MMFKLFDGRPNRGACGGHGWLVTLSVLCGCAGCPPRSMSNTWQGEVVKVSDGDTVKVTRPGRARPVKIRLQGVDTPEMAQPFGEAAKRFTADLVFGKTVTVEAVTTDRYNRTVAHIRLGSKRLDAALVRAGLAWHYKKYSNDKMLARLEREARAARRGVWGQQNPEAPWHWRHNKRGGSNNRKPKEPKASSAEASTGPLHGNTRSRKYHRPSCKAYRCKNCTREFATAKEAEAAGFKPCGMCGKNQVSGE